MERRNEIDTNEWMFGPFREMKPGEKVDPKHVIVQTRDTKDVTMVPVRIYGNKQESERTK